MRTRSSFPTRLKSSHLLIFMVVLLALRTLVPTGYMVEPGRDDGHLVLEICNGQTANFLLFDLETGEATPVEEGETDHDGQEAGSCPYALTGVAHIDDLATVPVPLTFLRPSHDLPQTELSFRSNLARAPPPARAPPVLI